MKARFLMILVPLATSPAFGFASAPQGPSKNAQPDPFALVGSQAAVPAPGARPSDEAIRAAVRATLEEMPYSAGPANGQVLSGGAYREFERKFSLAEKTHCLGPDPLKHQPHSITTKNWVFGVGGIFAAPFWAAAVLRGKCNWTR